MEEYLVNDKIYQVSEDMLEKFLAKYPDAVKQDKEQHPEIIAHNEHAKRTNDDLDLSNMNIPPPLKDKIAPLTPTQIKIESEKTYKSTLPKEELAVYEKSNIIPEDYFEIDIDDKDWKPIFSKTGRIINQPKTRKLDANEMEDLLDTTEGMYKNILLSPKNFDLPYSNHSENASYDYTEEMHEIQDAAYKAVKEKTGLNISKHDFDKMYSKDAFNAIQYTVATNQKINNARLALANDILEPGFKQEQLNIFYNSKSNNEKAKIDEVAKIRKAEKNEVYI